MILYYTPKTCALAPHIALEETGAEYQSVKIDFAKNEQRSPQFLAVNPKGRVPALVTEKGTLTETPALLAFLAQSFPASKLAPIADPFAFAAAQAFNNYLSSTMHVAHAHKYRGSRWVDDDKAHEAMIKKVPQNMNDCCALIEGHMFKGPYVLGKDYSICDIYLFAVCTWLPGDGVDIAQYPKLAAHFKLMSERPAVKKVMEINNA